MVILRPLFRNDSSRIRWVRTSKLNSVVSKISSSGQKVILVPVFLVLPISLSFARAAPRS